jgi:hypothetical protein
MVLNQDMSCSSPDMEAAIARRYADTYDICVGSMKTLPKSFFVLFIIESYHMLPYQDGRTCPAGQFGSVGTRFCIS